MKERIRYLCVNCGHGGSSGREHNQSPPSYHCDRCEGKGTMWPEPQAKAYIALKQKMDEAYLVVDGLLTMHSQAESEQDSSAGRKIRRALAFLKSDEQDDWTKTSDRMPTAADADPFGEVFWRTNIYTDFREEGWRTEALPWDPEMWYSCPDIDTDFFKRYSHWKPTGHRVPKPPKIEYTRTD